MSTWFPYNPVSEHDQYSRSPKERVMAFYDTLKNMVLTVWCVKSTVQILTLPVANCVQIPWNGIGRKRLLNMRNLKQGLIDHTELTKEEEGCYGVAASSILSLLCLMCFYPNSQSQVWKHRYSTFRSHRRPAGSFNSVMNLGQITSALQLIKVILQNIANIFC